MKQTRLDSRLYGWIAVPTGIAAIAAGTLHYEAARHGTCTESCTYD